MNEICSWAIRQNKDSMQMAGTFLPSIEKINSSFKGCRSCCVRFNCFPNALTPRFFSGACFCNSSKSWDKTWVSSFCFYFPALLYSLLTLGTLLLLMLNLRRYLYYTHDTTKKNECQKRSETSLHVRNLSNISQLTYDKTECVPRSSQVQTSESHSLELHLLQDRAESVIRNFVIDWLK